MPEGSGSASGVEIMVGVGSCTLLGSSTGAARVGRYMVCPLHNYRFDPKNGRAVGVVCSDAKTYRIREQNGDADVWL